MENAFERRKSNDEIEHSGSDNLEKMLFKSLDIDKNEIFTIIHSSLIKDQKEEFNATDSNNTRNEYEDLINQPATDDLNKTVDEDRSSNKSNKERQENLNYIEANASNLISQENNNENDKLVKSKMREMIKPRVSEPETKNINKTKVRNADTKLILFKASINKFGNSHGEFRSYSMKKNKKITTTNNEQVKHCSSPLSQKRKMSSDEAPLGPSTKLVKLVPIESILNKGLTYINKMDEAKIPSANTSCDLNIKSSFLEIVKSEPESDDDFQEHENLEAKKR